MQRKSLRDILDEGGYIDYRDLFRTLEMKDEFHYSGFKDEKIDDYFEEQVDSHQKWLKFLKQKVAKTKKKI